MARSNRDDFTEATKKTLCLRVGARCSNPDCGVPTTGPTTDSSKVNSIGQAAHIAAAASGPGAARYDASMTPAERSSINNGIWLCQNCATKIDRDEAKYTVALLHRWKRDAENAASEEQGKTPVSRQEYELLRAHIFKKPLGRSVHDAVSEMARMAARELEDVDPRFSVEVDSVGGITRYILNARERVDIRGTVVPGARQEFRDKMRALVEHGTRLEMDSSAINLSGSALFDVLPRGEGKLTFETRRRIKAVQKLVLTDPATGRTFAMDDFVGEIVFGTQTFTFEGYAFDGLYGLRYSYSHATKQATSEHPIQFTFNSEKWCDRSVRQLPYFDKLYRHYDALRNGWHASFVLEVEGNEWLSGRSNAPLVNDDVKDWHIALTYTRWVRELLTLLKEDVPYSTLSVSSGSFEQLYELWLMLCELPRHPGSELSTGNCKVVPQDETEAKALRASVEAEVPMAVAFGREFPDAVEIFGVHIAISPVRLHYSKVHLQKRQRTSEILPGKSVSLSIKPTEDCVLSVELSNPPCTRVSGPTRTISEGPAQ